MINKEILEIARRIKKAINPEQIYLFGSYARGEQTEHSDYDFYVVVDDNAGNVFDLESKAYLSLWGIKRKPCDILVKHKTKFYERAKRKTLENIVVNEGVLL